MTGRKRRTDPYGHTISSLLKSTALPLPPSPLHCHFYCTATHPAPSHLQTRSNSTTTPHETVQCIPTTFAFVKGIVCLQTIDSLAKVRHLSSMCALMLRVQFCRRCGENGWRPGSSDADSRIRLSSAGGPNNCMNENSELPGGLLEWRDVHSACTALSF